MGAMKEAAAKAKKEEEMRAKQQKQEKEKLEKLKKEEARETNEKEQNYGEEKTIKPILDDERKLDAAEESLPAGTEEETAGTDTMKIILEDDQPEGQSETKPTESVIKRGVPKNTKPAPAVVAIKMADLLTVPDEKLDNTNADMPDQNQQNNVEQSQQNSVEQSQQNNADPTQQNLLEKQSQDEKLRLEKEMKLQEKL